MTSRGITLKMLILALMVVMVTGACDLKTFASTLEGGQNDALALTQTFTDAYGMFTLRYPEGWVGNDFGDHVTFATSERALESLASENTLLPGDATLDVRSTLMIELEAIAQSANPGIDIIGGEHVADLVTVLMDASADAASGLPALSNMELFTANGHDAVRVEVMLSPNDVAAYFVEYPGDVIMLMNVSASTGELAAVEPLVRAILDTITVTPSEN